MRGNLLDGCCQMSGPLHRAGAGVKLFLAIGLVIVIVALPAAHVAWLGAIAATLIALAWISRISWRFLIVRMLLLEPFAIGAAALSLLQPGGWRVFLLLVARATLCLGVMVLLSGTTPFGELLGVLRKLRVPALLVTTLALMYRYLFVLLDESQRMQRARRSRTFTSSRPGAWKRLSTVAAQLFVRSSERAERIYAAMCARGWPT